MANTENPDQTGTVEDSPSTTTSTTTDETAYTTADPEVKESVTVDSQADESVVEEATADSEESNDEDKRAAQVEAARKQHEEDRQYIVDNPNSPRVREANAELGGEHF